VEIVRVIDMALIMAGGEGRQKELNTLLENIALQLRKKRPKFDVPETFAIFPPTTTITYPIKRLSCPSLTVFQKHMNEHHTPLILTDCLSHWPALERWRSPGYWLTRTLDGTRLVPLELGESYTSSAWSQKLVPFSHFLTHHLLQKTTPRGYLAQHDLLSQIPSLRNDILIPDYCYTEPPVQSPDRPLVEYVGGDGEVVMNIWMGPEGTRSPLHNDPYENVFAQVVGYKYFRLYAPRETQNVYPRGIEGGIQMANTSQVSHLSTRFPFSPDTPSSPVVVLARMFRCRLMEGLMVGGCGKPGKRILSFQEGRVRGRDVGPRRMSVHSPWVVAFCKKRECQYWSKFLVVIRLRGCSIGKFGERY